MPSSDSGAPESRIDGFWVGDDNVGLLTDLYELTMAASYYRRGMRGPASFELFVRHLPEHRNFLIACGLSDVLSHLERLHFTNDDVAYLRTLGLFDDAFLEYLLALRFTGEVWAVPEGNAVFAGEPLIRVTAPLIEAQIVETFLLNCLNFQTMVASKAARIALACGDRQFVDFSPRRDHGADAALKAARASFVGGAAGTSSVLAGRLYGIAVVGTMAHSYVMSFEREIDAFRAYVEDFPGNATLLVDTYDTLEGVRNAIRVAAERAVGDPGVAAIRLDSGDLVELARQSRRLLDAAGLAEVRIFASGDLDEYRIAEVLEAGAPVDAFGVGTQLGTSGDAPSLGGVYKLVEDAHGAKLKLSAGKATLPGRKQIYRFSKAGRYKYKVMTHDVMALDGETGIEGEPLLRRVMAGGKFLDEPESLEALRNRCEDTLRRLPDEIRSLKAAAAPYPVSLSSGLKELTAEATARVRPAGVQLE